jgi:ABC-type transport system involved in cytochrome bd biosynthesis fused ATPase/permease subunit
VSMANIVDSINTHARIYTDAFFPDNPICIQLQAFKENKKKEVKPSINLAIDYKGLECDMTMLSGGEQSRVVLAYALALAEMFSTPLMLLDECTSSLDQELTSVVFDAIRTNFNGRMTLIIAHQIIQGTFDKVIQLGVT